LAKADQTNSLEYRGFPISPGIAIGRGAVFTQTGPEEIPQYRVPPSRVDAELSRFKHAVNQTRDELRILITKIEEDLGPSEADIFRVHLSVLDDPALRTEVEHRIVDDKFNVESALSLTIEKFSKLLEAASGKMITERAGDIRDVGKQILAKLMLDRTGATWNVEEKIIVVAQDMTPAITIRLDREKILGFVAETVGPTSHAAILARSLEVPAVGAVHGLYNALSPSDILIVDGSSGLVYVNPPKETLDHYRELKAKADARRRALSKLAGLPAVTLDGQRVHLMANIGKATEVGAVAKANADGVGLFRTEFPFLSESEAPSEQEQFELYRHVVLRVAPNPVVIRTLDVGGDKFPPYIAIPKDTNPYLGWRGLRLLLRHKDIFKSQLRAILRASNFGPVSILYPVVYGLEELRMAKMLLDEVKTELAQEKVPFDRDVKQGIMVEVPSAVIVIDALVKEVDFLSVGTNDLTQYILAINRNSESLAPFFDPFHPAVLRALRLLAGAARRAGKPISICGELAGDLKAARLLLGLGFRQLSMAPASILPMKELIRSLDLKQCRLLALEVLRKQTTWEVHSLLDAAEGAEARPPKARDHRK
jgi:phosphotransferase system enzyme I (PtsI)